MKKLKTYICALATAALSVGMLSGCSDDMPAESYYTFTGETVGDFLQTHSDFSEFSQIVKKAGLMDLLCAYGEYTCFAATNDAVNAYLASNGFGSVDDIPTDVCDTIARTHLFSSIFYTVDFGNSEYMPQVNMLRGWLKVSRDSVYAQDDPTRVERVDIIMNNRARIIASMMNDSVENGVIHPVDAIMRPSGSTVDMLVDVNPSLTLFSDALKRTGFAEYISMRIKDATWKPDLTNKLRIRSNQHYNLCFLPEDRNYGFTVFVVKDDVIKAKLKENGIEDFTLQGLYKYACLVYDPVYPDVVGTPAHDFSNIADRQNPLNRLIAYHILDRALPYDKLTLHSTVDVNKINPTEWYQTMAPFATLKIENATVAKLIGVNDVRGTRQKPSHFINRTRNWKYGKTGRRGARVTVVDDLSDEVLNILQTDFNTQDPNHGANGYYYYVDDILDYGYNVQQEVFNDRMRIELGSLFPELATNGILGNGDPTIPENEKNETDKYGKNYWFPDGYLENCKIKNGTLSYQMAHNYYWSYQGDEFNLTGNTYDISFKLPPVPDNQYEVRIGFATIPTRGIAQIYFDGIPQGIPLDMTIPLTDPSIGSKGRNGWPGKSEYLWEDMTEEEIVTEKKMLNNLGYYRGPAGVYSVVGEHHYEEKGGFGMSRFYDNVFMNNSGGTIRKVAYQGPLSANQDHWLRFRSVWADGGAEFMVDYIEIVPKSVYGVEGEGQRENDL